MASRPPPRFVVRRHDDPGGWWRRRWWLALFWLISLAITALLAGLMARSTTGPSASDPASQAVGTAAATVTTVNDLKQQIANLQRAAQVNQVATRALRGTLTQREEEISGLRADLGFYSRLVGGGTQRHGLKVQEVKLQPISGSRGWNLVLSLTQNAKRGDEISGTASVRVEGLSGDKVVQLGWSALGDAAQKDGLPFQFMYFQQLQGTIVLPAGFRPTRLRILIKPKKGQPVTRTVTWREALSGNITSAQENHDAQP
ncbi:MAG: hypothetical protein EPN74_10050 [Rhodanobacter sp.]|nr:MAG: hypothetical protein EPN74_10050 [Rhodanobacter sp.]